MHLFICPDHLCRSRSIRHIVVPWWRNFSNDHLLYWWKSCDPHKILDSILFLCQTSYDYYLVMEKTHVCQSQKNESQASKTRPATQLVAVLSDTSDFSAIGADHPEESINWMTSIPKPDMDGRADSGYRQGLFSTKTRHVAWSSQNNSLHDPPANPFASL